MKVVFDANVIVAGVCWQGEGWLCLIKLARRRAFAYGTLATVEETRETALRVIRQQQAKHNAAARLTWYFEKVRVVDPAPLGKGRSRDPKDDPYLMAALAAKAPVLVTYDRDLLVLERPFGVAILRPSRFLQMV
ncbi:MAG: putative toxin-antitoxin system toxin component, PIN family [Verrucomicrobia bacterium]|nr:putative toxin-antitoxin system toxin component, PIN family [Verrucomicrobiota bacterium]